MEIVLYLALIYLYGSFAEWFSHKHLMHKKHKLFKSVYDLHTFHHSEYPRGHFNEPKSIKGKYESLVLCVEHVGVFVLPAVVCSLFWQNYLLASMFVVFGLIHYNLYNKLHTAMHLKHSIKWLPKWYVKACYIIHTLHHNHPQHFFSVSLPGIDWLLGTTCKITSFDKENCDKVLNSLKRPVSDKTVSTHFEIIKSLNNCLIPAKFSVNGYLSPPPTVEESKKGQIVSDIVFKYCIGPHEVHIIGKNLPAQEEDIPTMYVSNHASWADIFILKKLSPTMRIMAARSVLAFAFNLVGVLFGKWLGCFAVEADKKNTAVKTGIKVLRSGQDLGICAEGWAYLDQEMRSFKTGAIRVAHGYGKPLYIVPVYTLYGKEHHPAINLLWPPIQYAWDMICYPWAPGATTVVGEKIKLTDLPEDVKLATKLLEDKVRSLGRTAQYLRYPR